MRLITMADVHGNIEAFKSVVEDAIATYGNQIDGFVLLGDYCCDFLEGEECVQLITKLKKKYPVYAISGNRETGMVKAYKEAKDTGKKIGWEIDSTMGAPLLSCERMSDSTLEYLCELKENLILNFDHMDPIYLQHKMPLSEEMQAYLKEKGVKNVLTGHTHEKQEGIYGDFILFNPGSVGFTDEGKQGADYGVMTWKNGHWVNEIKHVSYDYEAEIARIKSNSLLMEKCKKWGEVLIASVETGVNVASLYMFEKNRIAKEFAKTSSKEITSSIDFGVGRYGNVSPIKDYLKESVFISSPKVVENTLSYKQYKTEDFSPREANCPVEEWMYDMALKNVLTAVYELKNEKLLEGKVYKERRM